MNQYLISTVDGHHIGSIFADECIQYSEIYQWVFRIKGSACAVLWYGDYDGKILLVKEEKRG